MRTSLVKTRRDGNILQARFPSLLRNLMAALPFFCGISQQHFAGRAHIPPSVRSRNSKKPCKNPVGANRRESPARKTPDENRRRVRRPKRKLGRGVRGLRSKRLGRASCACRNKLPTCQIIGSFHQIEEPNKEEKRVRLMTHSVDLGLHFGAK